MTTDRDGNRSNPYHPNPEKCCEACIFGSGEHAPFCPAILPIANDYDGTIEALSKLCVHGDGI